MVNYSIVQYMYSMFAKRKQVAVDVDNAGLVLRDCLTRNIFFYTG